MVGRFDNVSDSRMLEEIEEVADSLRLSDKDVDFLESENMQDRARNDNLSSGQRKWLEDIYQKACDLSEGHHA